MFVVNNQTMRAIDAATIAAGTPGIELMERAGRGAARAVLERRAWLTGTTLVVAGTGNNGGDGFVVARVLHAQGYAVRVLLTGDVSRLQGDALAAYERAVRSGVSVQGAKDSSAQTLVELDRDHPGRLVIDAVLGTGFHPPLRDDAGQLMAAMGQLGRRLIALDAPTGLDGDSGLVDPRTPAFDLTLTFGFPKWGLVLLPGRACVGTLRRVDLGFPLEIVREQVEAAGESALFVDSALAAGWWPTRSVLAHKFDAGRVLCVGASRGMSGAIALALRGAYRAGAGLVEALVPGSQRSVVAVQCAEALVHGVTETETGSLAPDVGAIVRERRHPGQAVVLGPGAGADLQTAQMLASLAGSLDAPLVVDADALNAFHRLQLSPRFTPRTVITPHTGELARLTGLDAQDIEERRIEVVTQYARDRNIVVVHKGAPTFVADANGALAVVGAGGPELATAGSGDVLTGAIATFLSQGVDPFRAACLGSYLHGRAGRLASLRHGVAGVMAGDVVDNLGRAARDIEGAVR